MRRLTFALTAVLLLAGCGDDDLDPGSGLGDVTVPTVDDGFADAFGGGEGGGSLTFDGSDHPIEAATCVLDDDRIDIGTVGDGFRVLVSGEPGDVDVQILDADTLQWFSRQDTVDVDGSTVTGGVDTYFNNSNDTEIEASFEIDCP